MKPTWTKRYVDRPGYPADPAVIEFVPAPKYSCEFNLNVFPVKNEWHLGVGKNAQDVPAMEYRHEMPRPDQ